MANKIIIGILAFLVVLSGGLCSYSFMLSQQINSLSEQLNEQLTAIQLEQATRIATLSDELTALRGETLIRADTLEGKIGSALARIGALQDTTDTNLARISTTEDKVDENLAGISNLEDKVGDITAKLPPSIMNASKVYQKVSQSTVRISNGEQTIGSGFIFDSEAHVVTAQHVVENLSDIYVVLPDGDILTATNSSSCQYSDIAVLTLEDKPVIEPPPLADSAAIKIGEPVVAIGNPFALSETLTAGIVSQTDRFVEIKAASKTRWVANLIQFDAAVNFGNSGCPLVNSEGEVIGLIIARIDPNEGDGIYYAVSSNKVKRVATSLINKGFFDYPWIGINITNLTPQTAQARDLETVNGILVKGVVASSPAATAGIQVDDIITTIDETAVRDAADLTSYLGEHKSPGEMAKIMLIRDTTKMELLLEIGKQSG